MAFPGVKSALKAIAGGGATEQGAYNDEEQRLTAARSAAALMDERVAKANMAGREDTAGAKLNDMLDMSDPMNVAIIAKLASQMNSAESARATKQETDFQGGLIDKFTKDPASVTPELANMYQAIAGRGAMMTGPNVNPTEDSQLKQENITALTNAADARAEASSRTNPVGEGAPYSKVTDEQMFMALGDDPQAYGDYYSWLGKKSMSDPSVRHNAITLARYVSEKKAKAVQEITGQATEEPGMDVKPGTTPESAIPAGLLEAPPAAGTWILVDGVPKLYKGQK